jgi:hypothetical protein
MGLLSDQIQERFGAEERRFSASRDARVNRLKSISAMCVSLGTGSIPVLAYIGAVCGVIGMIVSWWQELRNPNADPETVVSLLLLVVISPFLAAIFAAAAGVAGAICGITCAALGLIFGGAFRLAAELISQRAWNPCPAHPSTTWRIAHLDPKPA